MSSAQRVPSIRKGPSGCAGLVSGAAWAVVVRALGGLALAAIACAVPGQAQVFTEPKDETLRFRGQIVEASDSEIVLQTAKGNVRLSVADNLTVLNLTKTTFTGVDFGVYVGAASVKLDKFSPIIRDSMSYLHRGFELHIVDESLRGIALGHTNWDLTPDSVMSHGWVDDIEIRVLSIKYGPTEEEETDVEVPRNAPVVKMSLGDRSLIRPGAEVLAGAQKGAGGGYSAVFVMVGDGGVVPPM